MNKKAQMNFGQAQGLLSNFTVIIIFIVAVFVGGILAAVVYYDMNILNTTLQTVNFQIPLQNNASAPGNITDFQGILKVTVYPLLGLSSSLPYLTYFMIFGFVIALAVTAYASSKNPVFFVVHILFMLVIAYFCFLLSNAYQNILQNTFMNQALANFQVYNVIMLYLPAIVFFTGLIFGAISFVNIMKPQSNIGGNQQGLNYGPDY
jgi:hypothetical protein